MAPHSLISILTLFSYMYLHENMFQTNGETCSTLDKPVLGLRQTCLSIGEDTGIVASEGVLKNICAQFLENLLLIGELGVARIHGPETVVECKCLVVV